MVPKVGIEPTRVLPQRLLSQFWGTERYLNRIREANRIRRELPYWRHDLENSMLIAFYVDFLLIARGSQKVVINQSFPCVNINRISKGLLELSFINHNAVLLVERGGYD